MKRSSCEFLAHVEGCKQCRLNVEVIKRTKRPQREKENSVCYYALISLLSVLLCRCKLQCFGGLFPLSAYLIRPVTAAEEWKTAPPSPPQLPDTSSLCLPAASLTFRQSLAIYYQRSASNLANQPFSPCVKRSPRTPAGAGGYRRAAARNHPQAV